MEERNYKLYVHISPSNKRYYGITGLIRLNDRWQNGEGYKYNKHFYNAINKYGWDNFEHLLLFDNLTIEEAKLLEQMYIALYNTANPKYGYNKDLGGNIPSEETKRKMSESNKGEKNGFYGKHHTQETKDLLRLSSTGRKHTQEAKKKISEHSKKMWADPNSTFNSEEFKEKRRESVTGEKNGMYGKHHTEEQKQHHSECIKALHADPNSKYNSEEFKRKLREANKGREFTEDWRRKISDGLKGKYTGEKSAWYGKHHTEETRKKISESNKGVNAGENHPLYGKHHSEETRKKLSEKAKGRYKGSKSPNAKKIICVETGQIFGSIVEAKEWLGKGDINPCLKGRTKTAGGYHWEYVTEEQEAI